MRTRSRARLTRIDWIGLIFDIDFGAKEIIWTILCMYKQYGSLEGVKYPGVDVEKLTSGAARARRPSRFRGGIGVAGETNVVGPDSHCESLCATRTDFVEETGAVEDDDAAARGIDVDETAV